MENKINGNRKYNEKLFDYLPVGILVFDSSFKVKAVNENFSNVSLLPKEEGAIESKSVFDLKFVQEFGLGDKLKAIAEVPLEKELVSWETPNGRVVIVMKAVPFFEEDDFAGGLLVLEDVRLSVSSSTDSVKLKDFLTAFLSYYDAVVYLSNEGRIKTIVQKRRKLLNENAKFFKDVLTSVSKEDLKIFLAEGKETAKGNVRIFDFEKDEERLSVQVVLSPFDAEGEKGFIAFVKDVTEEEENKKVLLNQVEELNRFQVISESFLDGIFVLDLNGNIKTWNAGMEELSRLSKSQIFNKFISKAFPQFTPELFEEAKISLLKAGKWESEFNIGNEEKEEPIELRLRLIERNGEKEIAGIVNLIGEQLEMEKELRRSEALYRNIVTHSNEYICILNTEGNITFANPALRKVLGIDEEEILNRSLFDFVPENKKKKLKREFSKLLSKKPVATELSLVNKAGKEFYVLAKIDPIFDFNNELLYYNVILVDITSRKESERDIQLIRTVFEASIDGISVIKNRKIILANDAFATIFGRKNVGEVIGQDPLEFCEPSEISTVAKAIQQSEKKLSQSQRLEYKGLSKNKTIYVENSLSSFAVDGEVFIVSIVRDITEKKIAQEKLERSEKQYRHIVNNIDDFLWRAERIDGKLKQVFYTNAVEKILGYSGEEFIRNRYLWRRIIHPTEREKVISKLKSIYSNKSLKSAGIEFRAVNKYGNILWLRNKLSIIRDENGEIKEIVGLVSDITLSKRAEEELKRSAEELRTLNETKDRFLSIISHDLRTPFSSILGYTDLLLTNREMSEEKRVEYISFIQESAKNMLNLVNSLLDWTRLQTGRIKFEPKRLNAGPLVNNSIGMLNGTAMQKNINLVSNVDMNVYVHADENLLLQVFNNLISNAIKFTKPGGSIEVSAKPVPEKNSVEFCVADTGVGIKPEDMEKLFRVDSKFTLEGTAGEKGSGLGLSLVYDIVKKHGGEIWVKSKYGKGSRFYFTIPASSTSVLIVDDNQTDRILYTKLLSSLLPGYSVKNAPNGKVALEIVKSSPPALLIVENKMPLMNGMELAKQISLNEDVITKPPVIVLARNVNEEEKENYKSLGVKYIFEKPVELDLFKKAIENSLKEIAEK